MKNEIQEIILLNGQCRGFSGSLGLRNKAVICVDRHGREVRFLEASEIPQALQRCLSFLEMGLARAAGVLEVAEVCARFWIAFIAIHPFEDGNGRTGKLYLSKQLAALSYNLYRTDLLDRYLILGKPAQDVLSLRNVFLMSLEPQKTEECV